MKTEALEKVEQWRLRLSDLGFNIVYRASIKFQVADALSRVKPQGGDKVRLDDEVLVLTMT